MTEGETEERFRAGSTWHALQRYLADHPELAADHDIEPYITMTPSGWLRRA
jgi:cephalosporin hydroxylase